MVLTIVRKWLQALVEIILLLPLLIIAYVNLPFAADLFAWVGTLVVLYMLGTIFARLPRVRNRGLMLLASVAVSGIVTALLWGLALPEIVTWLLGCIAFYRGQLLATRRWHEVLPISIYWVSVLVYFISSILFSRLLSFESYMPLIAGFGFATLVITLWMTNIYGLQDNSYSDDQESGLNKSILRHNRIAVISLVSLALIVAFFKVIQGFILWGFRTIGKGIAFLLSLLDNEEEPILQEEQPPPNMDIFEPQPESEPAWWLTILDYIGYTIAIVVGVLLIYYGGRTLFRLLASGIRKLIQFLKERGLFTDHEQEIGFVDEKQQLFSLKEFGRLYRDRVQQWLADRLKQEPKWKDLQSNRERARYLYRRWLLHRIAAGFQFKPSMTPKEIGKRVGQSSHSRETVGKTARHATSDMLAHEQMADDLISLYEKARYSHTDISDEEIARVKKLVVQQGKVD